jgi:DNA repair protein RecO (recombination protein O)
MLERTEGIVLKNFSIGEADLIVTYLTRDSGVLRVFAKSPRKVKSRFGSSLEPLTYSRISFIGKEDANLPRLTQSDILRPFHKLREDYLRFIDISDMLELNIKFLPARERHTKFFNLLLGTLFKLESDSANLLYTLYYRIKFLEIAGYLPALDVCGRCGVLIRHGETEKRRNGEISSPIHRFTDSPIHNFYISHGAIICEKCSTDLNGFIRVSTAALKFYMSLVKWQLSNISRINAPDYLLSEIGNVVNSHIKWLTEHK